MTIKEIEIYKIKPMNLALIVSAFYFFIGVLTAILSTTLSNDIPPYRPLSSIIMSLLVIIIISPIVGWLCGFLFAIVYNFFVKWMGGIRITVKEENANNLANQN